MHNIVSSHGIFHQKSSFALIYSQPKFSLVDFDPFRGVGRVLSPFRSGRVYGDGVIF
jgi:hypothetical protein